MINLILTRGEAIKILKEKTGLSVLDVLTAYNKFNGDIEQAEEELKKNKKYKNINDADNLNGSITVLYKRPDESKNLFVLTGFTQTDFASQSEKIRSWLKQTLELIIQEKKIFIPFLKKAPINCFNLGKILSEKKIHFPELVQAFEKISLALSEEIQILFYIVNLNLVYNPAWEKTITYLDNEEFLITTRLILFDSQVPDINKISEKLKKIPENVTLLRWEGIIQTIRDLLIQDSGSYPVWSHIDEKRKEIISESSLRKEILRDINDAKNPEKNLSEFLEFYPANEADSVGNFWWCHFSIPGIMQPDFV